MTAPSIEELNNPLALPPKPVPRKCLVVTLWMLIAISQIDAVLADNPYRWSHVMTMVCSLFIVWFTIFPPKAKTDAGSQA